MPTGHLWQRPKDVEEFFEQVEAGFDSQDNWGGNGLVSKMMDEDEWWERPLLLMGKNCV